MSQVTCLVASDILHEDGKVAKKKLQESLGLYKRNRLCLLRSNFKGMEQKSQKSLVVPKIYNIETEKSEMAILYHGYDNYDLYMYSRFCL